MDNIIIIFYKRTVSRNKRIYAIVLNSSHKLYGLPVATTTLIPLSINFLIASIVLRGMLLSISLNRVPSTSKNTTLYVL